MVQNSSTMHEATLPPQDAEMGDAASAQKRMVDASSAAKGLASLRWNRSPALGNAQRLPRRPAKSLAAGETSAEKNSGKAVGDADDEEVTSVMCNLRPRRSGRVTRSEGTRQRTSADAKMAAETKDKMRFSLTLSKEEIEEDFLLMTGGKPSRRPSRRNKQVQKDIDNIYPGSLMKSPRPGMYKTNE